MNWRLVPVTVLAVFHTACVAGGPVTDARANLKKWGLAYCLSTYQLEGDAKESAAKATGAYFQRGGPDDEAAYENVRLFFDVEMKANTPVSHADGMPMPVVACLDLYESKTYQSLIEAQDKYVGQ